MVILGGAKVAGKIELIHHLMEKAHTILIGGAMAFTFLKVQGKNVGSSIIDEDKLNVAEVILALAKKKNTNMILPVDVVAAPEMAQDAPWRVAGLEEMEDDESGFDIGPETTMNYELLLSDAKTIIWNGPMGVCEIPAFATGTQAIASAVRDETENGAVSIIGGGHTSFALKEMGLNDGFTHISTGGGASLQLMSGKTLSAFEALRENE